MSETAAVHFDRLWKIYGTNASRALEAMVNGTLPKAEVERAFDCVIAISEISFSVPAGEVFCIMGLSGSGKSTLLRHVNRLIAPTAGRVYIDGVNIAELSAAALQNLRATKIGMVFQNVALFPHRTVCENVAFGLEVQGVARHARHARAVEKLEMVGLERWADRYPDELSGGMQQRVGLARALAADPEILLMDEPFSALDPLIRRQLQQEFVKLSALMKKTTIFVTHDLKEASIVGDRIAIMRDGSLVQVGTPEDIIGRPADAYVSEFVRDISPLSGIDARAVMAPFDSRADLQDCETVSEEANLTHLLNVAARSDKMIIVLDKQGRKIGLITREILLSWVSRSGLGGGSAPSMVTNGNRQ
jgi:glycine betaine/proline transport system ATP-binding protein